MSKHRVVKSDFWVDKYIEGLQIKERYFFLYLLTNPNTNILGIYQSTLKRICFETDLDMESVESILHKFKTDDKVHYVDDYVMMVNFQRHQRPNTTMKKGIISLLDSLPNSVLDFIYSKKSIIYDRLYRGYLVGYTYPRKDKDINKGKSNNKGKNTNPPKDGTSKIEKPENVTNQTWKDFLAHRKIKKANVTQTVLNTFIKQSDVAGITLESALIETVSRGWTGFKAEWIKNNTTNSNNNSYDAKSDAERLFKGVKSG